MSNELTPEEIWTIQDGEIREPGIQHLVITALLIGVGGVAGITGTGFSVGFGVTFFFPPIAIMAVGGIWYGVWGGVVASAIFPIFANLWSGTPPIVSILWIPANVIQGVAAGWVFRQFKLDPRLTRWKDYAAFVLVGGVLANIPGAFYGPYIGEFFGMFTDKSYPLAVLAWFIGNSSCAVLFGIILLKTLSPIVVKTRTFCKGWLA